MMGLIDSTNRLERAVTSAKQERRLERERKELERKRKQEDKLYEQACKRQALEELETILSQTFQLLGYKQASLYFKSIKACNTVLEQVTADTLIREYAYKNYCQVLAKVEKEQKRNWEYLQAQPPPPAEQKKLAEKESALAIAQFILALARVLVGAFALVILAIAGTINIANSTTQPTRYRRCR